MSIATKAYLKSSRDRLLGSILGYCERHVFSKLTKEEQLALRQNIMDSINVYHDRVLDLVKSDDSVSNEYLVELLQRVDRRLGADGQPRRSRTTSPQH